MARHGAATHDPEAAERADMLLPKKRGATRIVALVIAVIVAVALVVSLIGF